MKKLFFFILFLMVFTSCHDDSLTSSVSEKKPEHTTPKKVEEKISDKPSNSYDDSDESAILARVSKYGSELEELMRKDPGLRRIIEILESSEK